MLSRSRPLARVTYRRAFSTAKETGTVTPPSDPTVGATASTPKSSSWKLKSLVAVSLVGASAVGVGKVLSDSPSLRETAVTYLGENVQPVLNGCDSAYKLWGNTLSKIEELRNTSAPATSATPSTATPLPSQNENALKKEIERLQLENERLKALAAAPVVVAPVVERAPEPVVTPAPVVDEKLAAELAQIQQKLSKAEERLANIRDEHVQNMIALSDQQREIHLAETERMLMEQEKILKERGTKEIEKAVNQKTHEFNEERMERYADLALIEGKVNVFKRALDDASEYQRRSHEIHRVALASSTLTSLVDQAAPLRSPLSFLGSVAANNEVIQSAIKSIDTQTRERGVHPQHRLNERFPRVVDRARQVALVPEDSGIWGEFYGIIMNLLSVRLPASAVRGNTTQAILARAEAHMARGDLARTVLELETLEGRPREVVRDWVAEARRRAVLAQAIELVNAEANTQAESLS